MFGRKLTFLFIPDSQGISKQMSIPLWMIYSITGIVTLLLFASFFLASEFFGNQVNESELVRLQDENKQLTVKYEELRWNIAETETRYNDLVKKEIAIRNVFGLPEIPVDERQLGIGGPDPLSLGTMSNNQRLAYGTEAEVDHLLRLSEYELEKFYEAEEALGNLKDRLNHTPSIQPTKGWHSRGYGQKNDPFTGYKRLHRGVDISNHMGTTIIAPANGKVKSIAKYTSLGTTLTIDHGYGFVTRYGHLSKVEVKRGQTIKRGDIIAKMGNTGRSTGPHLHYEVWRNGKVLNPMKYILNDE